MTDEPKNYTEIFQKEIAESLKVNKEARSQRLELEDSLKLDPFVEHLYSEGEFEKLIFFELRKTNELLGKLVGLSPDAHQGTENPILTPCGIEVSDETEEPDIGPSGRYDHEPVDEETGIHQVDADSLSNAEKATLASNAQEPQKETLANKPTPVKRTPGRKPGRR